MTTRTLMVASLCLVVGLAMVSACAQEGVVRAEVPFRFTIMEKTLPPGEYTMIALPHMLKIKDQSGRVAALVLANEVSARSRDRRTQVLFRCYDDQCFLWELWTATMQNGRQLATPRIAAELQKRQTGTYFAVLGKTP